MLQDLYNSEINAAVWWNWDGGFEVRLGDGIYGNEKNWLASDNVGNNYEDVEDWLKETAFVLYPDSKFTKQYKKDYKLPGENEVKDKLNNLKIK